MKTEKSGGRPKKETSGFKEEKTIGFQNTKTKTKPNENVNDNNISALDYVRIKNIIIKNLKIIKCL